MRLTSFYSEEHNRIVGLCHNNVFTNGLTLKNCYIIRALRYLNAEKHMGEIKTI